MIANPESPSMPQPTNEMPPPPPYGSSMVAPPPTRPPERRRSGWHVAAIVIGCLALLPALGLMIGGGGALIAVEATDDGYFEHTLDRIGSDGVAVAAIDLWDQADTDDDWPVVLDMIDLDVRLRATGAVDTDEVFIGIARTTDVDAYLADTRYHELIDLDDRTPAYELHAGDATGLASPTELDIWSVSAAGGERDTEQIVEWAARPGDWTVVVMNADGTPGVSADLVIGAASGAITPVAVTVLVIGSVFLLGSIVLIVVGIRGRRR